MAATRTADETPRRPGGRSARVRSAVLRATVEELVATGYAALSLEGIARRAGVNKTTVYRRWGTRENLILEAMLDRGARQVPIPDTGALRSDLVAYGRAIVASTAEPEVEAVVRAVASIGDDGSGLAAASREFWAWRLEAAAEMVRRAVIRGEVRPGVDPALVAEVLVAPIYFRLLMSRQHRDVGFVERVADLVAALSAGSPHHG